MRNCCGLKPVCGSSLTLPMNPNAPAAVKSEKSNQVPSVTYMHQTRTAKEMKHSKQKCGDRIRELRLFSNNSIRQAFADIICEETASGQTQREDQITSLYSWALNPKLTLH